MNVLKTLIFGLLKTFLFLCLVGVGKSGHSAHDTEDVVVDGVHANVPAVIGRLIHDVIAGHSHHNRGGINAREVAGSGRLVLFGLQRERVVVDSLLGAGSSAADYRARIKSLRLHSSSVVLVRLDLVVVISRPVV